MATTKKSTAKETKETAEKDTKTTTRASKGKTTTTTASKSKTAKSDATATSKATKAKKTSSKTMNIAEQLAKAKEQNDNSTGGAVNIEQADTDAVLNEYSPEAQEFIQTGTVVAQETTTQAQEVEPQEQTQEQEQVKAEQAEPESEKNGRGRPKSTIKKKKILIYLPEELVERLDKIVQEAGQSRVGYIQRAVTTAVKLSEKE